jgi:hypothetical protein
MCDVNEERRSPLLFMLRETIIAPTVTVGSTKIVMTSAISLTRLCTVDVWPEDSESYPKTECVALQFDIGLKSWSSGWFLLPSACSNSRLISKLDNPLAIKYDSLHNWWGHHLHRNTQIETQNGHILMTRMGLKPKIWVFERSKTSAFDYIGQCELN